MTHLLDNPVWNALISGNKNLAMGNEQAKCFPLEVAPFTGLEELNERNFKSLFDIIPSGRIISIFSPGNAEVPYPWKKVHQVKVFQMIYTGAAIANCNNHEIIALTEQHVQQMLSLTKLTNPGPFYQRTIAFGNYNGIFKAGQLVAMAGQRMHAGEFLEISAVCTHPDHIGNGYARSVILHMVQLIRAQSRLPFLHVLTDNTAAIRLYTSLGFLTRREMIVTIMKKKDE